MIRQTVRQILRRWNEAAINYKSECNILPLFVVIAVILFIIIQAGVTHVEGQAAKECENISVVGVYEDKMQCAVMEG